MSALVGRGSRAIVLVAALAGFMLGLMCEHPAAQAVEALSVVTCHTLKLPCVAVANTASGDAVSAVSLNGVGVVGSSSNNYGIIGATAFNGTQSSPKSGIFGRDLGGTPFDFGILGTSKNGTGIVGRGARGGVSGNSVNGFGIWGTSTSNFGVIGTTSAGGSGQKSGTLGQDLSSTALNYGVRGTSTNGTGVSGVGLLAGVIAEDDAYAPTRYSDKNVALEAIAPNGAAIFHGYGDQAIAAQVTIDSNGDIETTGLVFTDGSCAEGCTKRRAQSYATTAATPTLEDAGEARLEGGSSYVRLDPSFANAIDPEQPYLVLITPETATNGVYVAQRSVKGFFVRENAGGRSSGAFAYRIVAHPYGVHAARLPFVEPRPRTKLR